MSKTYTEIYDTPAALQRVLEYVGGRLPELRESLEGVSFERCVFLGSGSSFSVCKSLADTARMMFGGAACALSAGDVSLRGGAYRAVCEDAVVVLLSRSGETSELGFALEALRESGARFRVLGIYCAENTSLAAQSDCSLELAWAFDTSVCQTRSVNAMYTAGLALLAHLAGDAERLAALHSAVEGLPAFMKNSEDMLKTLAQQPYSQAIVLADAEIAGLCEEGSLAFKEICQLPSNFYNLLDCRHGPMVLFDDTTLVFAVVTEEKPALSRALVADVAAKGCRVLAYSNQSMELPGAETLSFGRPLDRAAAGIPALVCCQLLSYYHSFQRGADPDQPTGLAACIKL